MCDIPETILHGAKAGQFFETWVISEIVKSYLNAGKSVNDLYYYRDADQREIDLVIESGRDQPVSEMDASGQGCPSDSRQNPQ